MRTVPSSIPSASRATVTAEAGAVARIITTPFLLVAEREPVELGAECVLHGGHVLRTQRTVRQDHPVHTQLEFDPGSGEESCEIER